MYAYKKCPPVIKTPMPLLPITNIFQSINIKEVTVFSVLIYVMSRNLAEGMHKRQQLPLKLAWAMTIHKSQGLTLSKAWIDIRKSEKLLEYPMLL